MLNLKNDGIQVGLTNNVDKTNSLRIATTNANLGSVTSKTGTDEYIANRLNQV